MPEFAVFSLQMLVLLNQAGWCTGHICNALLARDMQDSFLLFAVGFFVLCILIGSGRCGPNGGLRKKVRAVVVRFVVRMTPQNKILETV